MRKMLDAAFPAKESRPVYEEYIDKENLNVFQQETVLPMPGIAKEPIGMLKGEKLLLNEAGIRQVAEVWAGGDDQR